MAARGPKGQKLSRFNLIMRDLLKAANLAGRSAGDIQRIFSEARSLASSVNKGTLTKAEALRRILRIAAVAVPLGIRVARAIRGRDHGLFRQELRNRHFGRTRRF